MLSLGNFGTVYNAQRLDFPWSNDENTNIAIRILKGKSHNKGLSFYREEKEQAMKNV